MLQIITCDGRVIDAPWKREDVSDNVLPGPMIVRADIHHTVMADEWQALEESAFSGRPPAGEVHRRPSFTPSLGSKDSDHETLVNTVEVAAYLGHSSLRYSGKKIKGKVREFVSIAVLMHPFVFRNLSPLELPCTKTQRVVWESDFWVVKIPNMETLVYLWSLLMLGNLLPCKNYLKHNYYYYYLHQ